jgi:undecaprenyl diphosphate synthase
VDLTKRLIRYLLRRKSYRNDSFDLPENLSKEIQHIAIIMDGNGRWAKQRGLTRTEGHRQGLERVREITTAVRQLGIPYLTLFAFSTENWRRPAEEVNFLMSLFKQVIRDDALELKEQGIRLTFLGFRDNLDPELQSLMDESQKLTGDGRNMQLNLALNYGGRAEIVHAAKMVAQEVQAGRLRTSEIDDTVLSKQLFTSGIPDPDLLIRPSGELRISNFLLWQSAYTEFYFTPVLWPDFHRDELFKAIEDFGRRKRRFGNV